MNRKLIASASVAAVAGASFFAAASANADAPNTFETVSSFTVQGSANNATPSGWFSEGDDDVSGLTLGDGELDLAASDKPVGINLAVDDEGLGDDTFSLDATGSAKYSIVVASDDVDYLRLTADTADLDTWSANGTYWKDGAKKTFAAASRTLAQWKSEDFLGDSAKIVEIGARHFSKEGAGTVASLGFDGTTYTFTTVDAQVAAAVSAATAPLDAKITDLSGALDTANHDLTEATSDLATYQASHPHTDAQARSGYVAKSSYDSQVNALRALQAKSPLAVSGTLKVGKKLSVSGTHYSGVTYKYQWYVAGKKVSGATKSTYTVAKSATGHSVAVKVTRTYKDAAGKSHSVTTTSYATAHALAKK